MSKRVSTIQPRAQANKTTSRRNTSNPPTPKGNQPSGSSAPAPPTAPPPSFASSLPPLPTLPGTPPSIDGSSSIPFSNLIVRSTAHPIASSAPSSSPSLVLIQPPSTVVSPAPTPPVIVSAPESRPPSPPPSHTPVPLPAPIPRRSPRFVTLQQTPASASSLASVSASPLVPVSPPVPAPLPGLATAQQPPRIPLQPPVQPPAPFAAAQPPAPFAPAQPPVQPPAPLAAAQPPAPFAPAQPPAQPPAPPPAPVQPPAPAQAPRMVQQAATTGPGAMPAPASHNAPFFSARVDDLLKTFLEQYEELATRYALTDQEKVKTVIRFVHPEHRDLWMSLNNYKNPDWTAFQQELEQLYTEAKPSRRYSKTKLKAWIKNSSRKRMNGEEDVIAYYRKFMVLSKPLVDAVKLTSEDRNSLFWEGFHPDDQRRMEIRLLAQHPNHSDDDPFEYLDVYETARAVCGGKRLSPLDDSDDSDHDNNGDDSDNDRDPRNTDREWRTTKRKSKSSAPVVETKVVRLQEPPRATGNQEMEELLKKMQGLDIRERAYTILYGQPPPRHPTTSSDSQGFEPPYAAPPPATYAYQAPSSTSQPWPRANKSALPPPPHFASDDPSAFFRSRARSDACAFCNKPGHRIQDCPTAEDYVRAGRAILRNARIFLPNGEPVPNDGMGRGLQASIDAWLAAHPPPTSASAPTTQVAFTHESPP